MATESRRFLTRLLELAIGLALVGTGASAAAAVAGTEGSQAASGTLDLQVTFGMVSNLFPCPADILPSGVPLDTTQCRDRTGTGFARGLGSVSETYRWALAFGPPTCPPNFNKPLAAIGRLSIAGKGEMSFTLAEGARCVLDVGITQNEPQEFTITGGTGAYAAASGRGTVEQRSIGGGVGTETWTGTLDAPGLTFDLTPPTLGGAVSKTVRAPKGARSARVTFKVTATDDVDGSLPVSCQPKSGSRFRIGRTKVTCEAVDTSANTATSSFTVTVKRAR